MSNMRPVVLSEEDKDLIRSFQHLFHNTGGNDVVELVERRDINVATNLPVAMLHLACYSQFLLLRSLRDEGLLS